MSDTDTAAPRARTIPIATLEPGVRQVAADKIARSPVQFTDAPVLRKPSWIRVPGLNSRIAAMQSTKWPAPPSRRSSRSTDVTTT